MKLFGLIFVVAAVNAQTQTTVERLKAEGFTTLVGFLDSTGLSDVLNNGTYTIFAPTNAAFSAVPAATLTALGNDPNLLKDVLLYHVAGGSIPSSAVTNELMLTMANGKDARFNVYTHNNKVTVEGCEISRFDLTASNGVIHAIDSVMMAPTTDLVGYVSGNSDLSTLLSLVTQSGLASALQKDGLTLFAPTNAAFARLSQAQIDDITGDINKLQAVLTYHVVGSTQYSLGLYRKESLPTLNPNDNLAVHMVHHGADVKVNNALVTDADNTVTNGVVHLIDHVLLPQDPVLG
ncbi:hypothetical protein ACF0H5_005013 [Mactra antiquata]